jgi:hypothetical protein
MPPPRGWIAVGRLLFPQGPDVAGRSRELVRPHRVGADQKEFNGVV